MSKRYSILILDDDRFLLGMYQKKFEQNGGEVVMAGSAEEALSKLREKAFEPDIILADIIMPGMDGLEFLSALKKEKLSEKSVIIMLTNESDAEKIAEAKSLGASGYIIKASSIPTEVVEKVCEIAKISKK